MARQPRQVGTAPVVEPDDPVVERTTVMQALNDYVQEKDARRPDKAYVIPGRPAMSMVFSMNVEYEEYEAWVKRATRRKGRGEQEINYLTLANILISNLNIGMTFNGENATSDTDGSQLTVTSRDLHRMLGVPIGSTNAAIKKLFGNDADILAMMRRVAEDAGYSLDSDVIDERDPLDS